MGSSAGRVRVWDPLIRIFHWSLVVFFTAAYLSGEEESEFHEISGYIVLGLVGFRLVWGFLGPRYARFSDFVHPSQVLPYLRSLFTGSPRRYLGHNPLGGLMVVALLFSLVVTGWSGLEAEEDEEAHAGVALVTAVYADDDDGEGEGGEFWEEIHEGAANFTLFLVFLHLAGVAFSSLVHRENLVKAMITGYKDSAE